MCKFGFNFFAIIIQLAPCMGQSGIVPGQSGFNKKDLYIKCYFLKSKLIHWHQCYL